MGAEQLLDFCLKRCHRSATKNRRQILITLVPVRLLLGRSPHPDLLEKYGLTAQFSSVSNAVKEANLPLLDKSLDEHEEFYIDNSIYLLLEKLKNVIFRNIFKRVAAAAAPETKLSLGWFKVALDMQGSEMEIDEIECMLANLIHGGM